MVDAVYIKCEQCNVMYWDFDRAHVQELSEYHMMQTGHTMVEMTKEQKMEIGIYL